MGSDIASLIFGLASLLLAGIAAPLAFSSQRFLFRIIGGKYPAWTKRDEKILAMLFRAFGLFLIFFFAKRMGKRKEF